jgi:hypothetical protein
MLLSAVVIPSWADNTKTTVGQVTSAVSLTEDVDYIVTSATPFKGEGLVNIVNTDHAVVILSAVKPSKASSWLKYIQVNGKQAVNNVNCQVKLYNLGCIILPYSKDYKPLTVYSEQNFQGDSCNDFGFENADGYMNTLKEAKLNNRIRSFKLKRGHMVTFSLRPGGRGYSRCFIAADKDVEMAVLPGILDKSISSYRVFKWYDAGKKQLANDLNTNTLAALNVQSSYTWSEGHDMGPDYECIPNHIYEDYPSSSAIGKATWSPHTKNNNEPRNSSDDHPQDLNTILNNWENMMRTGMRLCSPASWDGSDYWNATGFLAEFLDSVDARGWRCDIIDLHCYWGEGSFNNMHYWSDKYKRPIWVSEWCWGASWNSDGAFANGVTANNVRDALERICTKMNGWDYVERYYYWNVERDPSRLYKDGALTPAGTMYANMDAGIGYNGKYDFVPKTPKQYDPTDLTIVFDKRSHVATLKWNDRNGEMNASMEVQRRAGVGKPWVSIASIELEDDAATYTYADSSATNGCQYQILVLDANNYERKSNIVMAASSDLEAGDAIDIDGVTKYIGGNVILNGSFEMEATGWINGKGEPLAAPYFQVLPVGGNDDEAYLQTYGNGTLTTEMSLNTSFAIKDYTDYYFSVASCNMPSGYSNRLGLSEEGKTATAARVYINNTTANWVTQFGNFNSETYRQARVQLYNLGGKAQLDQMMLCQLFTTRDSAIADGVEKVRQKIEMFMGYNTTDIGTNSNLNTELLDLLQQKAGIADEGKLGALTQALDLALQAHRMLTVSQQVGFFSYIEKLIALDLNDVQTLESAYSAAQRAWKAGDIIETYMTLEDLAEHYLSQTTVEGKVTSPNFATASGWTTKCGTYQGGDQRLNKADDVTFWNAWWSGIDAADTEKTMAVKQNVSKLSHGLYALECKAATEHYCLSDQHGYITNGTDTENTATLSCDYYDLPGISVEDRWQTLFSAPVYVPDGGTVTIGFEGSKQGSLSGAWLKVGDPSVKNDKREGWWCATDFALKFTPLYRDTVVAGQWGVICLPYAIRSSRHVQLYEVVGINSDYTKLCLQPIAETGAGIPCIYQSETVAAQFLEYGESVTKTSDGAGNIRGFLQSSARVPANYYYVVDGAFVKLTDSSNRPSIGYYTGIMRPFTDNGSKAIPVIDEWDGATMSISGVTDEEKAKNEERLETAVNFQHAAKHVDGVYTPDGRRMYGSNLKPGLYIKVVGGRPYKTIVK